MACARLIYFAKSSIIQGKIVIEEVEIGKESATVINKKECLDNSRTHLFRVVQAF